jgi:glucose dehydrogenase
VLYATTPKLRVVALDAATGREIWTFDPNTIDPKTGRFRHRGVTVYRDRALRHSPQQSLGARSEDRQADPDVRGQRARGSAQGSTARTNHSR